MQNGKTKHLRHRQNSFHPKSLNSDFPAARTAAHLTACREFIPNAVFLQHIKEVLKVSLCLQLLSPISQLLGDYSKMQTFRKFLELFLGWHPEACVWLSLGG